MNGFRHRCRDIHLGHPHRRPAELRAAAQLAPSQVRPPDSVLTRAAAAEAEARLTRALLNHSHRTFAFGAALGGPEGLSHDREMLFAAPLLHDTGLPTEAAHSDFTLSSARIADELGLSSAATETMRTAITLHHDPSPTSAHGPVAYLLAAGADLDVVGSRSWQLPLDLLASVVSQHPPLGSSASPPPLSARGRPRTARTGRVPAPLRSLRPRQPVRPRPERN